MKNLRNIINGGGGDVEPTREEIAERLQEPYRSAPPARLAQSVSVPSGVAQSHEAEKGVLSSILNAALEGGDAARRAMFFAESKVASGHFFDEAHREIWIALKGLHADNEPMDFITLTNALEGCRSLERVGGAGYITELALYVPTAANIDHYADILQEKHGLRCLAAVAERLRVAASDGAARPGDVLDEVQEALQRIKVGQRVGVLPDLDDMADFTGDNLPTPPAELVSGLLHQGSKLIIGGTSKGRKTFSLMDLAISVATGADWWGHRTIKGKVCYINFEIQRPFFAKRYADICRAKGVTPARGMFRCWTLRGYVEGIEKMAAEITKILLQGDYSLIIFDPIYKALGDRDENKAGDVASMLNELEAIAVKTGAAIAFGAHYSKGNQAAKDAMDRIGGSGVFARDPDAILTMTPHEEEEAFTVDCTLRNFAPKDPFVVRWDWPLFTRDEALDPESLRKPKTVGKTRADDGQYQTKYKVDHILDCLKETSNGRTPTELLKLLMEQTGMGKSKFWMLWDEAKASPYVIQKDRRFFHISSFTKQP